MPFDRIGDAVAAGELDAGVMIHEELLLLPAARAAARRRPRGGVVPAATACRCRSA